MKLIVSCTSTRPRLGLLRQTVPFLLNQSRPPDLLLVCLARAQFDDTDEVLRLVPELADQPRVRVELVDDLGPYTKLLPALELASDSDVVVTVDDDVCYDLGLLSGLAAATLRYPDAICCARARRIRRSWLGGFMNYESWRTVEAPTRGRALLPLGVGGVAYRRALLDLEIVFDPAARRLAPTADDLWFRAASLVLDTPVLVAPALARNSVELRHGHGLEHSNRGSLRAPGRSPHLTALGCRLRSVLGVNETPNDMQWDAIVDYLRERGHRIHVPGDTLREVSWT